MFAGNLKSAEILLQHQTLLQLESHTRTSCKLFWRRLEIELYRSTHKRMQMRSIFGNSLGCALRQILRDC